MIYGLPTQWASNTESIFISWRYHVWSTIWKYFQQWFVSTWYGWYDWYYLNKSPYIIWQTKEWLLWTFTHEPIQQRNYQIITEFFIHLLIYFCGSNFVSMHRLSHKYVQIEIAFVTFVKLWLELITIFASECSMNICKNWIMGLKLLWNGPQMLMQNGSQIRNQVTSGMLAQCVVQ